MKRKKFEIAKAKEKIGLTEFKEKLQVRNPIFSFPVKMLLYTHTRAYRGWERFVTCVQSSAV